MTAADREDRDAATQHAMMRAQMRWAQAAEEEMLLADGQRRMVLGFAGAGTGMLLAALVVTPQGAGYWLAVLLGAVLLGGAGIALGGRPGRRLDAMLMGGGRPAQARPPALAALPEPMRAAFDIAATPALLSALAGAMPGLQPREKAAAGRLLEAATVAWNAADDDAARRAVAQEIPPVLAALTERAADAAGAAEAAAARLAPAPGGGP